MSTNKPRILIVEDNQIAARVLKRYCQKAGFMFDHAEGCKEATALLLQSPYQLVFMDLGLQDGDGKTLMQWIREGDTPNQHTPIVVVSAHVDAVQREMCFQLGADEVIVKPVRQETIEQVFKERIKE